MTSSIHGPRRATTIILSLQNQTPRLISQRHQFVRASFAKPYSTQPPSTDPEKDPKTTEVSSQNQEEDTINGPLSTLPPPLNLPERGDKSTPVYLFSIGRAYGKFYWSGVKATWSNHKKAKVLKESITKSNREKGLPNMPRPLLAHIEYHFNNGDGFTRTQLQFLMREQYDFRKLPPFALMVALFGEWLPLIVPFVPSAVPRTCRIPKQIEDMRKGVEERRKKSFRQGLEPPKPAEDKDKAPNGLKNGQEALPRLFRSMQTAQHIVKLGKPQMMHISRTLGLGGRLFDSLGVPHPLFAVKLMRHLAYLAVDDELLLHDWVYSHLMLTEEETRIACEDRGIDVVGRKVEDMKSDLGKWLEGRRKDDGSYKEILKMLFTR